MTDQVSTHQLFNEAHQALQKLTTQLKAEGYEDAYLAFKYTTEVDALHHDYTEAEIEAADRKMPSA